MKTSLLILFLILQVSFHDYHLSVCEIKHVPNKKTLQVSVRIFSDDLEECLQSIHSNEQIDILNPANNQRLNDMIKKYVTEHLTIKVNGKITTPNYLDNRIKKDVVTCYLEIIKVNKFKSIYIENTMLQSQFSDQLNLVHISRDEQTKSLKLTQKKPYGQIQY